MLKKGQQYDWTTECKKAFHCLKEELQNERILVFPDFSKPFIIHTDASMQAIGFMMAQIHDDQLRPILFGGRTLNNAEKRYNTTDRELLGCFYAATKCKIYILGHPFIIYTDHKPLEHLLLKTFLILDIDGLISYRT